MENKYKNYNLDEIICTCAYISRKEIYEILDTNKISNVDELTEISGAGGGCGFCREDLEKIILEYKKH